MHAFVGQGFDLSSKSGATILGDSSVSSIGDAVRASLSDPEFDQAIAVVAFATNRGVDYLTDMYESGTVNSLEVHVGVDENVTSRDALESILESNLSGFVYHGKSTFHPKVFYFEGDDRIRALVGSGNLTKDGLHSNYEAALIVDVATAGSTDQELIEDLQDYISSIEEHGNELSDELITELASDGKIQTEQEQRKNRAAETEDGSTTSGDVSYQAEISRQTAPSLSMNTDPERETTNDPVVLTSIDEERLSRENMPDIPKATSFRTKTDRNYYKQLISENDNQVNFMRRIIRDEGEITKGELKRRLREQRDATISGSFDADLRVLWRTTNEVSRDGRGDSQILTWIGK